MFDVVWQVCRPTVLKLPAQIPQNFLSLVSRFEVFVTISLEASLFNPQAMTLCT